MTGLPVAASRREARIDLAITQHHFGGAKEDELMNFANQM